MLTLTKQRERRILRAAGFVPVEAKLHLPTQRNGLAQRGELVDRLRESSDCPVVLVTGPPGYGKTTLIRQWVDEDPRPVVWLTLDRADNDPTIFVTYLMLALERVEPVDHGILGALAGGDVAISTVMLPRFGRMLRERRPFTLVLDDAESLTSADSLQLLQVIADNLPDDAQMAMLARTPPDLRWSRLRAQRRLCEIGVTDLRLSRPEAAALLSGMGLRLPREHVDALYERTEGWAAGLYLAALSFRSAPNQRKAIDAFTGDDSVVASYLRDELLASLPDEEQEFLVLTSILTRLCGRLCDAVLATTGSDHMLQRLARENLFVIPLDRKHYWFRFHHLFADMLRTELDRRDPELVRTLHARASAWCESEGDAEEAISHAIAAGEGGRAARLVWSVTAAYLASGRRATLERWLESFTDDQVVGQPHLALTAAWCAAERGRPVEHWISATERVLDRAGGPDEQQGLTASIAVLRAQLAQDGVVAMGAEAERALQLQAPEDPWRTLATFLKAVSLHLTGHQSEAVPLLEETDRLAEALGVHSLRARALAQLAVIGMESNDWTQAIVLVDEATAVLQEHNLASVATMSPVHCASTLALAKRGLVEEAKVESRRAVRLTALLDSLQPWAAVQSRYLLARAHLMLGDTAAARVLLSEAQTGLRSTADAVVLHDALEGLWQQLEEGSLGADAGWSTLTSAEVRVLQFLPTYLSFEEIGKRLFVSRNTVKTQAIAAYRKLGVSSRAEAVERALALGMIEE